MSARSLALHSAVNISDTLSVMGMTTRSQVVIRGSLGTNGGRSMSLRIEYSQQVKRKF